MVHVIERKSEDFQRSFTVLLEEANYKRTTAMDSAAAVD